MDRFDVAEAVAVLCWDYGLYGVWARIEKVWRFNPRPSLRFDTLGDESLRIYHALAPRAEATGPYDERIARP